MEILKILIHLRVINFINDNIQPSRKTDSFFNSLCLSCFLINLSIYQEFSL